MSVLSTPSSLPKTFSTRAAHFSHAMSTLNTWVGILKRVSVCVGGGERERER